MAWYDIGDLLTKAPLEEVISRLGMKAERRGHQLRALCPFHQDSRPSLNIYPPEKGGAPAHFHCFSCGAHGNAIDLVKEVNGYDFSASVDWLARNFGIQPAHGDSQSRERQVQKVSALDFALRQFEVGHDAAGFRNWCSSRGFDHDLLKEKGLRLVGAPVLVPALQKLPIGERIELLDGLLELGLIRRLRPSAFVAQLKLKLGEQYQDYFRDGRVVIPVYGSDRQGSKIVGFAGRLVADSLDGAAAKYMLTPGFKKSNYLFNAESAFPKIVEELKDGQPSTLYLVEGFLDALRLEARGQKAVALMGTSLGEGQFQQLAALVSASPSKATSLTIAIFLDNDPAGFDGSDRLARDLLGLIGTDLRWIGAPWRNLPEIGKDPDSCLLGVNDTAGAKIWLNTYELPAEGILVAGSVGGKDSSVIQDGSWTELPPIARERALHRAAVAIRKFTGKRSLDITFDRLSGLDSIWAEELLRVLRGGEQ